MEKKYKIILGAGCFILGYSIVKLVKKNYNKKREEKQKVLVK